MMGLGDLRTTNTNTNTNTNTGLLNTTTTTIIIDLPTMAIIRAKATVSGRPSTASFSTMAIH